MLEDGGYVIQASIAASDSARRAYVPTVAAGTICNSRPVEKVSPPRRKPQLRCKQPPRRAVIRIRSRSPRPARRVRKVGKAKLSDPEGSSLRSSEYYLVCKFIKAAVSGCL